MSQGYWYLASPYSHEFYDIMDERAKLASHCAAWMVRNDAPCYAPIAFWHHITVEYKMPTDAANWRNVNMTFLRHAIGVRVLLIDGWKESKGVKEEVEEAKRLNMPVEAIWRMHEMYCVGYFDWGLDYDLGTRNT